MFPGIAHSGEGGGGIDDQGCKMKWTFGVGYMQGFNWVFILFWDINFYHIKLKLAHVRMAIQELLKCVEERFNL